MANVDDLLNRVADTALRADLADAIKEFRKTQKFGLVFEPHVPETAALRGLPLAPGALCRLRTETDPDLLFQVLGVNGENVTLKSVRDSSEITAPRPDVLTVKRFGEPVYPALTSLSVVRNGRIDQPHHVVVDGENFHALQLFVYLYKGEIDCIYIDPPFNSGARDWKYNNRYVDINDSWRHSKWLSFMQKRLALAKRLLKEDGVLVCAIDENEHAHLVALLQQEYRGYDITSVAVVHNPRGIQGDNFSYTNEFAVFVIPSGKKVIADRILPPEERDTRDLRDNGGQSRRTDARNCFYPIIVKNDGIIGFGDVPDDSFHPTSAATSKSGDVFEVWPIDRNGVERKWRYARQSVESISGLLSVAYSRNDGVANQNPQIKITKDKGKYRTVWSGARYDANAYGTKLVTLLTGTQFPFPKSVFTIKDILLACTRHKPNALILDFFAGSGTTLHATCMVNAELGGSRKCLLVTNNEVGEKWDKALRRRGLYPGDEEYEAHGIFEAVTVPRCVAAITGKRTNGEAINGTLDGRPIRDGFSENVIFLRIDYLEPDEVDLGMQFDAIVPALWCAAGAVGEFEKGISTPTSIPSSSRYAVLLDERHFRQFRRELERRSNVRKAWLVTDSEWSFAEMRSALPGATDVSMLYRDYLRNFRINTKLTL